MENAVFVARNEKFIQIAISFEKGQSWAVNLETIKKDYSKSKKKEYEFSEEIGFEERVLNIEFYVPESQIDLLRDLFKQIETQYALPE